MHIAIDARIINSGTGTHAAKLLEYLQQIDTGTTLENGQTTPTTFTT